MRISAEERRQMNRRMKNRIPPAVKASVRRVPLLVMVVSTTLFVTPEAWARIQTGQAEPSFFVAGQKTASSSVFTKTYTKEELNQQMPANPVIGIDAKILTEVTGVLNGIARNLSGTTQVAAIEGLKTRQPEVKDWALHVAALKDPPGMSRAPASSMTAFFGGEGQKVATTSAKTRVPFFSKFGSGMKFDFGLSSLFGGKKAEEAKPASGQLRYGLLVQDIEPAKNAQKRAALNDTAEEMQYAGHAEVKWTIGPLDEDQGRRIFTEADPTDQGITSGLKIPKPDFKANVAPENFDNLAKVDPKNPPVMRLDVTQVDGFYNMAYKTKLNGKRVSVEHSFTAPVAGTVALGRRFTDNWDVVETSAYNILYDKRLPMLSVHYMNIEQRYKSDLAYNFSGNVVGVTARGKALGPVAAVADGPENYSVNVTRNF